MSTKSEVLKALMEEAEGISGERLARRLKISRNSVWKAIVQLRDDGYEIEAITNRGYRLKGSPDRISEAEISRFLNTREIGRRMELHELLDSTNNRAKAVAATGAPHGYLVISESQDGGRGRFGRPFFSMKGMGIYITYVLRPTLPAERAVMITSMTAVAVARAIERLADAEVKIKWVNDLFINGRKICGILCEANIDFESGQLEYAVVGIGVNVGKACFPQALEQVATSIENECGVHLNRNQLIAEISNEMETLYDQLDTVAFMREYRMRSNVIGREVEVFRGSERFTAQVLDIDDQGRLVIRAAEGIERVNSGEISLKLR